MKVIKEGKSKDVYEKIIRKTRIFTCNVCDCVFEADDVEYKYHYVMGDEWYTCDCPNCHLETSNSQPIR